MKPVGIVGRKLAGLSLDARVAVAIFGLALLGYGVLALRIAAGDYLDYWNLVFDFDSRRYAEAIARPRADWASDTSVGGPKHPLLHFWAIIAQPLTWIGFSWKQAASLTASIAGAGAAGFAYLYVRAIKVPRTDALLLTTFFAVSSSQLFNAFVIDSYAFAQFGLAFAWALAAARLQSPDRYGIPAHLSPIYSFGMTVTNIAQAFLAEAAVRAANMPLRAAFNQLFRFAIVVGLIILVVLILKSPEDMWWIANHPVDALKVIFWAQTKGETYGFPTVLLTFFGYGFVAPRFTTVALPGGAPMLDFRDFNMTPPGLVALALWAFLSVMGIIGALRSKGPIRWLYAALSVAIVFNLMLHGKYQFRGAIFLYSGHINFAIFAFSGAAAHFANEFGERVRSLFRVGLAALIISTAAANVPRANELATAFDEFHPLPEWGPALNVRDR